jgi:hypothetical protein
LKPIWFTAFQPCGTRPGNLLRQSIPIRGAWTEAGPGWLELDAVARGGGALDDLHWWRLDAVDIRTAWVELRALENRGQPGTLTPIRDLEASLPFRLLGVDSDHGGEFLNHHLAAYWGQRKSPCSSPAHARTKRTTTRMSSRATGRTCASTSATNATTIRRWCR